MNKENKFFYKTIDFYLARKGMTRSRLSILCDKDMTVLNPSKTNDGKRWITMGFFLKICEVLEIKPQQFFRRMEKLMEEN